MTLFILSAYGCGYKVIKGLTKVDTNVYLQITTYSQGGAKFPTGGISVILRSPRALFNFKEVSRTGKKPVPTV